MFHVKHCKKIKENYVSRETLLAYKKKKWYTICEGLERSKGKSNAKTKQV